MENKEKKYSTTMYQSGTLWLHGTNGTSLYCGYWSNHPEGALRQRGSHERTKFVCKLVDVLNEMEDSKDWVPWVWLSTVDFFVEHNKVIFRDPFFGNLDLSQTVVQPELSTQPVPEDFVEDLNKLRKRVLECDKED
jgi:hypothetical protein